GSADELQEMLQAAGVQVWRDTVDLLPGEDWRIAIRRAISDDSLVFLACFSQNSAARDKSFQNEELVLAVEQLRLHQPDKPWLFPVRFDDCQIPDRDLGAGRTLASIQRADLFGDRRDQEAARLVAAVRRILDGRSAATPDDGRGRAAPSVSREFTASASPTSYATRRRSSYSWLGKVRKDSKPNIIVADEPQQISSATRYALLMSVAICVVSAGWLAYDRQTRTESIAAGILSLT